MSKNLECEITSPAGGPGCNECGQWSKVNGCRLGHHPHGADQRRCEIFHCDARGDRYCCYWCYRKKICKNPCINNPSRCGKMFLQEEVKGK